MFNPAFAPRIMSQVAYRQVTGSVLMVRPAHFGWNVQTAVDNVFQQRSSDLSQQEIQELALQEFDALVDKLRAHSIRVVVIESDDLQETPDSVFPNNWISFHEDSRVALFPMFSQNRRKERRLDIIRNLADHEGFKLGQIQDYSFYESQEKFLEGTGSLVLDREHRKAYAALSNRTNPEVLKQFCSEFAYDPVTFEAFSTHHGKRVPIYHTNVMMNVGEGLAVLCAQSIDDPDQRTIVIQNLESTGKELVFITEDQNGQFAGNMLQLRNAKSERFLVMSDQAYHSLNQDQIAVLEKHSKIIHSRLDTIESNGGGSARCMIAEIFLPNQ